MPAKPGNLGNQLFNDGLPTRFMWAFGIICAASDWFPGGKCGVLSRRQHGFALPRPKSSKDLLGFHGRFILLAYKKKM